MELRVALSRDSGLPSRSEGAALFADVSGFTPLMAKLAAELGATRGAEEVTRLLDELFSTLTKEVHSRCGSVIDFAGDSILCWFDDAPDNSLEAPFACDRAAATAVAMHRAMIQQRSRSIGESRQAGLDVKIAIASGIAHRFTIGDPTIRRMLVLAGEPIDRVASAEQLAQPGDILCSEEMAGKLRAAKLLPEPRKSPEGARYFLIDHETDATQQRAWPPVLAPLALARVRPWLLPSVAARLERGEGEFLAGFKPTVALFIRFGGVDYDDATRAAAQLDSLVRLIQRMLDAHGGDLLSVTVGDKGSYLYATFGALRAHEHDARRAVAASLALQERARTLGFPANLQIGIAEGPAYAGAYGGDTQRTFGVLGKDVNLAARLMSEAPAGGVWLSPSVAKAVERHFDLREEPMLKLKGFESPIAPHLVISERASLTGTQSPTAARIPTIGRTAELARLERGLDALFAGTGSCLLVEGDAGLGKTHLVEQVVAGARARGARTLAGGGDPMRSAIPYGAWRPIFEAILGITTRGPDASGSAETRATRAREAIARIDPTLDAPFPLLGPVLGIAIADTLELARLDARARADNTNDLLIRLLRHAADESALVVVMEDAHWLDSASIALLARGAREITGALLVITSRSLADSEDGGVNGLASTPRVEHIVLGHLDRADTEKLVCRHLGVTSLPTNVARLIADRAEGSPFFSQQIAESLLQGGYIAVSGHTCTETSTGIDPSKIDFPTTIHGLIASRIDSLPSRQQLAAKIASVVGRYFPYRMLHDVHPLAADKPTLRDDLAALAAAGVTVLQGREPELAYAFRHALTHEVAYGSLLYRQRCELHRAVGAWYEQEHVHDLAPQAAVLAHHWSQAARGITADDTSHRKAIDYLELAGTQALRSYSNREAARFLGDAVALDAARPSTVATGDMVAFSVSKQDLRRARWYGGRGHAHLALSDFASCRTDLYAALKLLGHPIPRTPVRLGIGIFAQIAKQATTHLFRAGSRRKPLSADESTILNERSDALRILAKAFFHENDPAQQIYANLCDLNYAERLGPSPALALIYSHMLLTLGVFQIHPWARRYGRRSLEIARRCDDPATLVTVLVNHGVYHTGNGEWSAARAALEEGRALAERLGDYTQWGECMAVLADVAQFEGDLARSAALYGELAASAERRGNVVQAGWSLRPRVLEALRDGQPERAIQILNAAVPTLQTAPDRLIKIDAHGLLALAHARAGDAAAARASIARANQLIAHEDPPVTYPRHLGLTGVAEACLLLVERALVDGASREEQRDLLRLAAGACRNLHRYRRVFRVGAPAAWRCQGWLDAVCDKRRRARAAFAKSIAAASGLQMTQAEAQTRALAARLS